MRYNVAQLVKGPTGAYRQYDVHADIRNLDPEMELARPLVGWIKLMRTSQGVLATGKLETSLRTECRRCLEPCDLDVVVELEEEFYPTVRIDDAPLDDVAAEDRDVALRIDEHHILDLSEVIRQALWLAGPEEALCREDCAGLCPDCGGNRNLGECTCEAAPVDPRWAALQSLLTQEPDS
jgi:uncharacterized protein